MNVIDTIYIVTYILNDSINEFNESTKHEST
jgi:hypothetical protein